MKKMSKFTKKLLLSALALGLAVVTLTTTTYAWYTSSQTATAGSGSAESSGTTADSSLMISNDGITFGTSTTIKPTTTNLIPIQYDEASGKFVDKAGTAEIADTTNYYKFTLYFKATSEEDVKVYISGLTIANVIKDNTLLPKYDNLVGSTLNSDGIPNDSKYAIDVVTALDMVIGTGSVGATWDAMAKESYKLDKTGLAPVGFGTSEVPNANAYYDTFMGETTVDTASTYNSNLASIVRTTPIGTIPSGQILEVTFVVYLNGWDNNCFDACRGQSFELALSFSSSDQD